MPEYVTTISETQGNGEILLKMTGQEKPKSGTFGSRLNGLETAQHSFHLGGSKLTRADWRELIDPWRRTIDVDYGGALPYSGLIMGWNWDEDTEVLTVASAEARTILARRMLYGIGTYGSGTKVLNGRSLRGHIYQILYYATQGNLSSVWNMRFTFPAFDEAGSHDDTYWNYLFENAEMMISDLTETENGPDFHLQARRLDGISRDWLVRVGDPILTGPAKEYHGKGEKPTATAVQEKGDGQQMVTGIFTVGNGSEEDMKHGEAATVAVPGGYPSLDVVRQFKNIDDVAQLDAFARAEREAFRRPTSQSTYRVAASSFFPDGLPGSPVKLWMPGSKFLPDEQNHRCIGYQGDITSEFITIDTQEV